MYYPAAAIPPVSAGFAPAFDTDTQEEIKTQINAWLNKE